MFLSFELLLWLYQLLEEKEVDSYSEGARVIADSVLPLRADGSVYHLNLLPNEVAETVILVGDPDRVALVSQYFDSVEIKKCNREFVTHTGWFSGKRLSVVSTGIGTANIEIVLNEIDALHNIDFVTRKIKEHITVLRFLRIGTCGVIPGDVAPGACVLSQYALGFDGQMNFYPRELTPKEHGLLESVEPHLSTALRAACYATQAASWFDGFSDLGEMGVTFTCPGFYAAQNRRLRVPIAEDSVITAVENFSWPVARALNFEMETAMIYGLGRVLGHDCGSLSLAVYNRHTQEGLADQYQAMSELIQKVLNQLANLWG
jgi:uridine phosphorylase